MRNKIDYGIDLGTTNSAIARMENGVPVIKKNEFIRETTPSCINYGKKQNILIGDMAFQAMRSDAIAQLRTFEKSKINTFTEFKRTMGTTHKYESARIERNFTSDELSSEILKKLKSFVQDDNISSIVITVPAKFLNPQNEATMQAARLAGFKHIELLQEPVAAAIAYGLGSKSKDGYWLVFDFGGGTFDVALIKAEEGLLAVKDTDGDNWLGGKNLDEAIVDQLIIPNLQQNYSISSILEDTEKKEILRNAVKFFAEEAKIQLSSSESYNILSNLGDLPFEDDNGEEPEIDIVISQTDMAGVVAPMFQKAIDITILLLERNNLKGADLGALILVGGPTYSPILRRMLKEQITDKIDSSVDPMTVVAKGAAIFASTISVSDEVKENTRDRTKLQLDIRYEATTVELDEIVSLKIIKDTATGISGEKIYADVVRSDGAWSSGKTSISEKATIIDVLLVEGRSNSFEITVYSETGNKLDCQPNQFSILQGIGVGNMSVLNYHIGIGKYFHEYEKNLFEPIKGLEKNKSMPVTGVHNGLKTRSAIRKGMISDIIRIPIYQGDHNAAGTNPSLNNLITEVVISGKNLPALLPEGSDVEITIKVDRSQLMKFSAYFPLLNHTEDLDIEIRQTESPSEEFLIKEISNAKRIARRVNAGFIDQTLDNLRDRLENEKGNADGKMSILDSLRKELLKLDVKEKENEWPELEQELRDNLYQLGELLKDIKTNGDDDKLDMKKIESHFHQHENAVKQSIVNKNRKEAKHLLDEIASMDYNLRNIVTDSSMDVDFLKHIDGQFTFYHWKDIDKARQLINQGLQAVSQGKTSAVRPFLIEIVKLMPDNEKPTDTLG